MTTSRQDHKQHQVCPPRALSIAAFTIVEVLVAMAVLAMLLIILVQMFGITGKLTSSGQKRMDSERAGREALGILGDDLKKMIVRPYADLDVVLASRSGNDRMFFYAQVPGFSTGSNAVCPISLVGHRINSRWQLERLSKGLRWSGVGESPVFLALNGSTNASPGSTLPGAWPSEIGTAPDYEGTSADYQVSSGEVFRLEFCLMGQDGRFLLSSATWRAWEDDDADGMPNLKEIKAVVVAIAVLDAKSRLLVRDMGTLAAALPDPTAAQLGSTPPELIASVWKKALESSGFAATAGVPPQVAANVRVYQSIFVLNDP